MSEFLLDSHTMIWFFQDDGRLSPHAKGLIEDPSHHKWISIASCWEVAIKVGLGKLNLGEPTGPYLHRAVNHSNFDLLQISLDHATSVETLPQYHKDPFDRLLIAQAIMEGLSIISVDVAFDAYPVRRVW
jgi:PIN domain nuclease of toxin-antitoxin system